MDPQLLVKCTKRGNESGGDGENPTQSKRSKGQYDGVVGDSSCTDTVEIIQLDSPDVIQLDSPQPPRSESSEIHSPDIILLDYVQPQLSVSSEGDSPDVKFLDSPQPQLSGSREGHSTEVIQITEGVKEEEPEGVKKEEPVWVKKEEEDEDGQVVFDPHDYIDVQAVSTVRWKKGPVTRKQYKMKMKRNLEANIDPQERLMQLQAIMEAGFEQMRPAEGSGEDRVQVILVNDQLHTGVIPQHKCEVQDLRFDQLAARLCAALQSDESIQLEDTIFQMTTWSSQALIGSSGHVVGLTNRSEYSMHEWQKKKKCIYDPVGGLKMTTSKLKRTMGNMCVPLVLARELYVLQNPLKPRNEVFAYSRSDRCCKSAMELVKQAGLTPELGPFTLEQVPEFTKCLPENTLLSLYDNVGAPLMELSNGVHRDDTPNRINMFIAYNEAEEGREATGFHCYGITSMAAFVGEDGYCHNCHKGIRQSVRTHRCTKAACTLCKQPKCKNRENLGVRIRRERCPTCNTPHHTKDCLQAHKPECRKYKRCYMCNYVTTKANFREHICGQPECTRCLQIHSPFSHCYVTGNGRISGKKIVWYADCETQVDPATGNHSANLVILQKQNSSTFVEFKGADAMVQFVAACMAKNSKFKDGTIVFHNAAGFDAHLWYKELLRARSPPLHLVRKGQKIIGMEMRQNQIKCRDSLQFIPGTPLAAFPKMFGLEAGPKGDFPHRLNTPQWIQWGRKIVYREVDEDGTERRFPKLTYFLPETKSAKQLHSLCEWHNEMETRYAENTELEYIPELELVKYCQQDVRLLHHGFETYRQTWLTQYPELEPLDSLTFPSYNNRIFREQYMMKDSLCLLPPMGYTQSNRRYSTISMAWLAWMEKELGLREMRTGRKGYEVAIAGFHVDGTGVDPQGARHVLQFHGCYWHGHECKTPRTEWLDDKQEQTRDCENHLEFLARNPNSPYGELELHTVYECEFRAQLAQDATMKTFVTDYLKRYPKEPLCPRLALRGGRTEAIQHRVVPVDIQAGWQLVYDDFTSLYPAVNFGVQGEMWPVGHPDIYLGKDMDQVTPPGETWSKEWFGLVKLEIHPPRHLQHPVLGQLVGGKLLFHLCTKCAEELVQGPCDHSEEERLICGTFFTGEVQLALENGYRVKKIHELWNWPEDRRDPHLFRPMIKDQYAKKALASAVPQDPEEFQRLLDEYEATMDLHLEPEQFKENSALRALAKFSLNNIWGFLGRRNDVEETVFLDTFPQFLELENDPDVEITRVIISQDAEQLLVTHKKREEAAARNGNICLAVMTTAYARMALYQVLSKYGEHVVYMDTDSLFLLLPPGVEPPPTSTVLGALKDEIKEDFGPAARISEFASLGPKSYTYRVVDSLGAPIKEVVKVKGVRFNVETASLLTPKAMTTLTRKPGDRITAPQYLIRKDMFKTRLWNSEILKKVQFQSSKRWFLPAPNPTMNTRPYGFCT